MPSLVNRRGHSPPRSWNRIALQRRFSRRFTRSASDFNRSSIPTGRWQESCSRKLIYLTSLLRTPIFHPNQNFEILVKSQLRCTRHTWEEKRNYRGRWICVSTGANSVACESNRDGEPWNIVLELIADNYDALLRLGKMLGRDFWKENFF